MKHEVSEMNIDHLASLARGAGIAVHDELSANLHSITPAAPSRSMTVAFSQSPIANKFLDFLRLK